MHRGSHIAPYYIADPGQYMFSRSIYGGVTSISQAVPNFYDYVQGTVKLKLWRPLAHTKTNGGKAFSLD